MWHTGGLIGLSAFGGKYVDNSTCLTVGNIWTNWNIGYGTAYSKNSVWPIWCGSTATATTANIIITNNVVWDTWVTLAPCVVTAEQAERNRKVDEEARKQQAERDRLRREADATAERLLLEHLTPEQQETYKQRGCFYLKTHSADGIEKRYRIDRGRSRNVRLVDERDQVLRNYCIHPREMVPDADTMLVQKLMLEAAEPEFLRIANAS
jgi:hypothetical protein